MKKEENTEILMDLESYNRLLDEISIAKLKIREIQAKQNLRNANIDELMIKERKLIIHLKDLYSTLSKARIVEEQPKHKGR